MDFNTTCFDFPIAIAALATTPIARLFISSRGLSRGSNEFQKWSVKWISFLSTFFFTYDLVWSKCNTVFFSTILHIRCTPKLDGVFRCYSRPERASKRERMCVARFNRRKKNDRENRKTCKISSNARNHFANVNILLFLSAMQHTHTHRHKKCILILSLRYSNVLGFEQEKTREREKEGEKSWYKIHSIGEFNKLIHSETNDKLISMQWRK